LHSGYISLLTLLPEERTNMEQAHVRCHFASGLRRLGQPTLHVRRLDQENEKERENDP
jgi:hypothetical protein